MVLNNLIKGEIPSINVLNNLNFLLKTNSIENIKTTLIGCFGKSKADYIISRSNKTVLKFLTNINSEILSNSLNFLKNTDAIKIVLFFEVIETLQIKNTDDIDIIIEIIKRLKGENNFKNALKIQDNYINEILHNRKNFTKDDKINAIYNATKSQDTTHIIKKYNTFINTDDAGNITETANCIDGESKALGLFADDMQFLNEYNISSNQSQIHHIQSEINIHSAKYKKYFKNGIEITQHRLINKAFFEKIYINNPTNDVSDFTLTIGASFLDIFQVRGKTTLENKNITIDKLDNRFLISSKLKSGNTYGIEVDITQDNINYKILKNKVIINFSINPNSNYNSLIRIQPCINGRPLVNGETTSQSITSFDKALDNLYENEFINNDYSNSSTFLEFDKTIKNAMSDIELLKNQITIKNKKFTYISAGVPRYAALFGRDSLLTSLMLMDYDSSIARDNLEILANFQGKTFNERFYIEIANIMKSQWPKQSKHAAINGLKNYYIDKEEENGKILHELRFGELSKTTAVPHSPYYGTVDATPLWLIVFCEYFNKTNDINFVNKYMSNAIAAINWIERNMDNSYLRFKCKSNSCVKIQNQGWKDAGDSIKHNINKDDYLDNPEYPIALAEVQAYVYRAYNSMSVLFNTLEDYEKAKIIKQKSKRLKKHFNNDFWMEDQNFYSMALDNNNNPVKNITSNIGHCLTMGIIDNCKINTIEQKLISPEMFTGWGIRTLSSNNPAYDPLSYHNGSVWIHDSAIVAMGLSKESKLKVTQSLFEAATMFKNNRLPELFGGFQRKKNDTSIQIYPEACSPQAWASASLIWLSNNMLKPTNNLDIKQ